MDRRILRLYGAYNLQFRRCDGEWTIKRLSTQSHSKELAERILEAIETLPIKERTKETTDALAQRLFDEEHYGIKESSKQCK